MRVAWTRASTLIAITVAACLTTAILVVAGRGSDRPAVTTALGRQLAQLEQTVVRRNVHPFNPSPDPIAVAYLATVRAGQAQVIVHTTYHAFRDRNGGGVVDLAQDSGRYVGSITGVGPVEVRVVRGDLYVQRQLATGQLSQWYATPRTALDAVRLSGLSSAPVKALELLGRLRVPVRHATVVGPGFAPCQGLIARSDLLGRNPHGKPPLRTGVCLDAAGRIASLSLRFAAPAGIDSIGMQLSGFGPGDPILAPARDVVPPLRRQGRTDS